MGGPHGSLRMRPTSGRMSSTTSMRELQIVKASSRTLQRALRGRRRPAGRDPDAPTGERTFESPRPLRQLALFLAPVPAIVALWALGALSAEVALGLAAFQIFIAVLQCSLGVYELHRSRRLADAELRAHPARPPVSALAAWRSAELTSERSRRRLARHLRGLRRETDACLPSQELHLSVLEESVALLRRLEARLGQLSKPVSPLGMLDLRALVMGDVSPLYFPERADAFAAALSRALAGLEPARL